MAMRLKASELYEMVRECTGEGRRAAITATGTSMLPFIRPGDIVILAHMPRYRRGDIVLAQVDEGHEVVLHAVIGCDSDGCTLMGLANLKLTEKTRYGDMAGAVVAISREGRSISTRTRAWRGAMELWLRLRPLRRPLLKALGIFGII